MARRRQLGKDMVLLAGAAAVSAIAASSLLYKVLRRWKRERLLKAVGLSTWEEGRIGLAVDMGSSSVRCSAYVLKPDGVRFIPGSLRQVKRDAINPKDGTADAEQIVTDIETVIDGCLNALRAQGVADSVAVLGFAAFVMNLVGVDAEGKAVTPVLTYADRHPHTPVYVERLREQIAATEAKRHQKTSSFSIAKKTTASAAGEGIYDATGAPIHTAYAAPQLWRLAEEEPETMKKVEKWQTLTSLTLARWTSKANLPISFSEASWTGMFDFRRLTWCSDLLALLPINAETLPALADYNEGPSGNDLSPLYRRRWPELVPAKFFLGLGDGACANIGSGCRDVSRLAVTVGTSAAARVVIDTPSQSVASTVKVPHGLWCYRIDRSRLILGGALTDGGSLVQWMTHTFQIPEAKKAELLAAKKGPDSHGLSILPFLSGERAPGWNPDAKAVIAGLTKATESADIYRAGLESIALRLGGIVALMSGYLGPNAVVGASGTALECSALWRQILADVLGLDVVLGKTSEATSVGAAILMAEGLYGTRFANEKNDDKGSEACHHFPDAQAHTIYQLALKRQNQLYDALYLQKQIGGL